MALPNRITSITVPSTAMYNDEITVAWAADETADSYRLYVKGDTDSTYSEIYSGSDTKFTFDVSKYPDYNKMRFRVYGENSDGTSDMPCESKEVTVIDAEIRESENGDVTLLPFNLSVNMLSSKVGDVPDVRETSEQITGLDGELPVDMKYSPRLFDLVTFMKYEFSNIAEREEYIRQMSAHINRSVRKLRYLLYRNKIFGVKRISSEFSRRPAYCSLDISYKCYEVFGYGKEEKALCGDGICEVSGDTSCYPVIILEGEKNNPVIKVNGVSYQIALDTSDGDIVAIDCEKETVTLENSKGEKNYLAGAFYLDFPVFNVGENTIQGCDCVRWRDKWFIM